MKHVYQASIGFHKAVKACSTSFKSCLLTKEKTMSTQFISFISLMILQILITWET